MQPFKRLAALLALASLSGAVLGQGFPNKPIRLIVPYPAGESIDSVARLSAQHWSAALGQPLVIDNRGGAGGTIGPEGGAKAGHGAVTDMWGKPGAVARGGPGAAGQGCARGRAAESMAWPAGEGTVRRIGLVGKPGPSTAPDRLAGASSAARRLKGCMVRLRFLR